MVEWYVFFTRVQAQTSSKRVQPQTKNNVQPSSSSSSFGFDPCRRTRILISRLAPGWHFPWIFSGLPYGPGTMEWDPWNLSRQNCLQCGVYWVYVGFIYWVYIGYFMSIKRIFFVGSTLDAFFTIPVISSAFFEVSFYIDHPQFNWGWFIIVLVSIHEKDLKLYQRYYLNKFPTNLWRSRVLPTTTRWFSSLVSRHSKMVSPHL